MKQLEVGSRQMRVVVKSSHIVASKPALIRVLKLVAEQYFSGQLRFVAFPRLSIGQAGASANSATSAGGGRYFFGRITSTPLA